MRICAITKTRVSLLPLTFLLLLFPSLKYRILLDGEWPADYYGFPLPWNSDSLATSLAKEIYVVPLAVDLLFSFLLALLVYKVMLRLNHRASSVMLKVIWSIACVLLVLIGVLFSFDVSLWPNPGRFQVSSVSLHDSW